MNNKIIIELKIYSKSGKKKQRLNIIPVDPCFSGPKIKKTFLCSTEVSMEFVLLINIKMPTIVGILIFICRKIFDAQLCFAGKKFKLLVFNFFISRTSFIHS